MLNKYIKTVTAVALLASCHAAQATIVEVKTNLGNFEINLFDQSTPITVDNFLNYANSERFNNTVMHRSIPGFVIQGGGFIFEQQLPLTATATNAAIVNEPKWSNVRGTVAMAKLQGNPDSATNQWFINLSDNAANLDNQNSGFTVFGHINAQGMEVIDAIAKLARFNFPSIQDLPLQNYTAADRDNNKPLVADNFVTIESITVVDASPNTEDSVAKIPSTASDNKPGTILSSGSFGLVSLFSLMLIAARRRIFN